MNLDLKGKKAFVSGSTVGIGYAIAKNLASEGAEMYVNGRTQDRVNQAVAQIKAETSHSHVVGLVADVSTTEGVARISEQLPDVDILINNAGIAEPKSFREATDKDWEKHFEVNVLSGVRLSRAYFGGMLTAIGAESSLSPVYQPCRSPRK